MKQRKKPSLRFKGFDNDWEQRKLGDVLVLLKDGTHGTHKDAESGPLLLSAKNIKDGTVHWDESDRRISEDEYNSIHTNFQLQKGDVLLTIVGSIGETAILSQSKGVTFQRSVAFLRPSDEISSEFLYSEIQGQKFQKELNDRKSTSAQPGIYLGDLGAIPIEFPTSDEEQTKVGRYFRNLDHLITLHQRKLEKLQNLKKAMLEKMFPKNGAKVPEIRFKGFTNDWEQRKIADVAEIITGGTPSTRIVEYWNPPEVLWLSSGEVHKKYITSTDTMISRKGYENSSATMVRENSVLIALAGQGKTRGTVAINRIPLSTNQSIAAMTFSDDIDPDYVFSNLENRYEELRSISSGDGSRGGLNKKLVGDVTIPCPTLLEQNAIGTLFRVLNELITLHQCKLEKLQNLKKAMLEKMFI